jgi:O-methyltransferase
MLRQFKGMAWKTLRSSLKRIGIDAYVQQPGYQYVPTYYRCVKKHIDIRALPVFGPLAEQAIGQGKTLLDYDRIYTIYQALTNLARFAAPGDTFNLAEVGVYRGGMSYFIASAAHALGLNPSRLFSFDTFEGHSARDVRSDLEPRHLPGMFCDTSLAAVKEYLEPLCNVTLDEGRFQENCSAISSLKFHFAHLDVDIYAPTAFALDFFDTRLIVGGTIVVDDYGFITCPGARKAVDEFMNLRPNYLALHLLTGQCVLVKYQEEIKNN